jgi:predicted permease
MPKLPQALRPLAQAPLVTAVACLSLALGIGANSAIFSLFDQFVLRRVAVPSPEQLVNVQMPGPKSGWISCSDMGECENVMSYPLFRDLEKAQTSFAGFAAHRDGGVNVGYRGETEGAEAMFVSGEYFQALQLTPAAGRLLGPEDNRTIGGHPVVVLTHDYWRARFDGSPSAIGASISINGQPTQIVGVAPAGFVGTSLGQRPRIFLPLSMGNALQPGSPGLELRDAYWLYGFARLKPGLSRAAAEAALNVPFRAVIQEVEVPLQRGMSEATLARFKERQVQLGPGDRGQSSLRAESRGPLLLLLGATAFVLLIACANVANLLLVRAAGRAGEISVRLAIGASRRQLVGQLLGEAGLLALVSGLGGLLVAAWTLELLGSLLPADRAAAFSFSLDPRVFATTTVLALAAGLLFGLFPALYSTRPNLVAGLKGLANRTAGSRTAGRVRSGLVTAQIALAMALLVSAGLFTKSLANVSRVDLGLSIDRMVTFRVSPALNGYKPEQSRALFARIEDELRAQPGVTGVGASLVPLLTGSNWGSGISVEGFQSGPDIDSHSNFNAVGPGFFSAVGVPVLAGREFTELDVVASPKVAIVNEAFARKFNLGKNVVGKRMAQSVGPDTPLDLEIVGLVADAKYSEVKSEIPPQFVLPYRQDEELGAMSFYVRSATTAEALLPSLRATLRRLDPNLPLEQVLTLETQVRDNVYVDRLIGTLSAAFAVLATLLAAIGLYGVLAYTVAQRTREIGLRMALGADAQQVRSLVLRQVGVMTAVGGALGIAAALGLSRLGRSLLYELEGHDPIVLALAALLLAVVAFGSGLLPALRAARTEPMQALRYE